MNRKLQLAGVVILVFLTALLLAFMLRDVVEQLILRPLAYLFWLSGIFYRFIPQPVVWLVLVLMMIYLALGSLLGRLVIPEPGVLRSNPIQGQVAELAMQIERKEGGIYFKWQIARILGRLALDIQELRQHIRRRTLELDEERALRTGTRPRLTLQVRRYQEAGLNTSFSDYPLPSGLTLPGGFSLPGSIRSNPATPFDGDIGPVIDYLESEMENDNALRRP